MNQFDPEDYDWQAAFQLAVENIESVPPGTEHSIAPFKVTDVAEVVVAVNGCNDEDSWFGVFKLRDGRYVSVSAWCDYSGWG